MTPTRSSHPARPPVLQAEDFVPLLGRDVRFGETGVTLVLADLVRPRGPLPAGLSRAPFTLIFSGPRGESYLLEGLYRCDFSEDAAYDIHVSPISTIAADRQDYQAVFN